MPQIEDREQPLVFAGDAAHLGRVGSELGIQAGIAVRSASVAASRGVPQILIEDTVGDQLLDMADALVARSFKLLQRQPLGEVGLIEGPGALTPGPIAGRSSA